MSSGEKKNNNKIHLVLFAWCIQSVATRNRFHFQSEEFGMRVITSTIISWYSTDDVTGYENAIGVIRTLRDVIRTVPSLRMDDDNFKVHNRHYIIVMKSMKWHQTSSRTTDFKTFSYRSRTYVSKYSYLHFGSFLTRIGRSTTWPIRRRHPSGVNDSSWEREVKCLAWISTPPG